MDDKVKSFDKSILIVIIAYCAGILSYVGYQQYFISLDEPQQNDSQPIFEQVVSSGDTEILVEEGELDESDLENELALVKAELKQFKDAKKEKELADAKKKELRTARNKRQAELWKHFGSLENRKKRALDSVVAVSNELKGVLDLTEEQSQALSELLKRKVDADVESRFVFYSENEDLSKEERIAKREEMVFQMEGNQSDFEEQISYELSEEQVEKYLTYEQDKVKQQYNRSVAYQEARIQSLVPDLYEHQKIQIKNHYNYLLEEMDEVKIGSYGTPSARLKGSPTQDKYALKEYLAQVLTEEQFKLYDEQTKKR